METRSESELLLEIANCEIARRHLADPSFESNCGDIVQVQAVHTLASFQVPEPWNGWLSTAPILFVSSNPSISDTERYPCGEPGAQHLIDFFRNRFEGHWVRGGTRPLERTGHYGTPVAFWSGIQARASELLRRPAVPGRDYALTEIVHCKSKKETGVVAAMKQCPQRYLSRVLCCSAAKLVVIVGRKALQYFNTLNVNGIPRIPEKDGMDSVGGIPRVFVYLGHPTGPEPKRFEDWLSKSRLQHVRDLLNA
jgi:hypothetical protein